MKASNPLWRERLISKMPADLAREVDIFENEIELRKKGKIDEKVFAETRLRRGAYGQRYDNGHRHDGEKIQNLSFPAAPLTKGPETMWDAPGMIRIKIPFGGMSAEQLEVIADLAEEYADDIAHVTTRQDFQLHFVHIEDAPALFRRLAAVGITTREACGNAVRNVTACPIAGVCHDEAFDVTAYAQATADFLLGHPDTMDFGRKFKIAFSGCRSHACGLVQMHDMGAIAVKKNIDGVEKRGFELYVGGGLGPVPHQAKLLEEFATEEELLPIAQAVSRVFARLGEKKNRARARIKFVVAKIGIEEFRRLVREERATLPHDDRWSAYVKNIERFNEKPLRPAVSAPAADLGKFGKTNVYKQKQAGYSTVTVKLPLGDITAHQLRALADIARKYVGDSIRLTVEQNIVLRWVADQDLPALYADLKKAHMGDAGAETISDVTSCPGTDTCKLGIAASRGLAGEMRERLANVEDPAVNALRIKISGCFNSCGQHHVADLGFYGMSRKIGNYTVPHFQMVLGGQWKENAGSYGLPLFAIPSKNVPTAIERITSRFSKEKQGAEDFRAFLNRIGKAEIKKMMEDLIDVPSYAENPDYYSDWGDPREFSIGDMGVGECAGEVVSLADFDLTAAEREVFEAQIDLEKGDVEKAGRGAYHAMLMAARGLVRNQFRDCPEDPGRIVEEFKKRFVETEIFAGRTAGEKFHQYLFLAHEDSAKSFNAESAHARIAEAQLFVEACFAANVRMSQTGALTGIK